MALSLKKKLFIYYLGSILISILSLSVFYFKLYGADLEQDASISSAQSKYLVALYFINGKYRTHYRCPASSGINTICILAIQALQQPLVSSEDRAVYWLTEALKQDRDHTSSLSLLAKIYLQPRKHHLKEGNYFISGELLPNSNYAKAAILLERLVSLKADPEAYYTLGWLYLRGLGTPTNKAQAKKYLMKAAQQGHTNATMLLQQEFSQ